MRSRNVYKQNRLFMEYILQQLKVVLFHDFGYVSYCVEVASPPIPRCIFPGENCLAAFAAMLRNCIAPTERLNLLLRWNRW